MMMSLSLCNLIFFSSFSVCSPAKQLINNRISLTIHSLIDIVISINLNGHGKMLKVWYDFVFLACMLFWICFDRVLSSCPLWTIISLQELCVQFSLISYCIFKRGCLLRNCFKFHTSSTLVLALQIFVVISMLCIEKERLKRTWNGFMKQNS